MPKILVIVVILSTVLIGTLLLLSSRAATPFISTEPETGTITVPGSKVTDSTASGGSSVKFGIGNIWGQGNPAPPSVTVLNQITLNEASVMQSTAYDATHKIWIFAQVMGSTHFNKTAAQHALDGDITLTKISATGQILGAMYLNGFGHGVSIGVEPVGSATYVWTESNAHLSSGSTNAFGTQVARFAWANSAVLTPTSSSVVTYDALPGSTSVIPVVDAAKNRIAVQNGLPNGGGFKWSIYALDKFKSNNFTPLLTVTRPSALDSITFQGFAWLNDQTIVSLHGNAYSTDNPAPGNTTIFEVNLTNGTVTRRVPVTVAPTLVYREPEGITEINGNVCSGFASGVVGARKQSVFCQVGL